MFGLHSSVGKALSVNAEAMDSNPVFLSGLIRKRAGTPL